MKTRDWVFVGCAVVVIVLVLAVYYEHAAQPGPAASTGPAIDHTYQRPPLVIVNESVANGIYTFAGNLPVPGCDTLSTGIATNGTSTISVRLSLTAVHNGAAGCENIPSAQQAFSVSFAPANKAASVTLGALTLNSTPVTFTVRK